MYYRQLSADIKMKKYKIQTSFACQEGPEARTNKTGIDFIIFILLLVENYPLNNVIHDFSVWHRTGSNPADTFG